MLILRSILSPGRLRKAPPWLPLVAMLVIAHAALLGPFLFTSGMPRGTDMAVNMVSGYVAENGTWHELWDDSRAPSQAKHVSRFAIGDLALTWTTQVTGDIFLSIRLLVWALHVVAMVGMFLYVRRLTGSSLAGALAGLAFVFTRGAPLRAITAMMAGFALMPWVFLAVDVFLEKATLRRSLGLALVLALFVTASIPPFTYIVGLALVAYVAAFSVWKALPLLRRLPASARPSAHAASATLRTGALAGIVVVATLGLSAYFLVGLSRSTAPLVEEAGGYSLEGLQTGLPSFTEALMMYRGAAELNPPVIDVAMLTMIVAALAAVALRFSWRTVALATAALGGVYLASDVTSPVYRFLYDHLPFFSSVRGTRRWTALGVFGFAALAGVTFAVAKARWQLLLDGGDEVSEFKRRVAGAAVMATGFALVFSIASQAPIVWEWLRPYQLTEEYRAPYEWLAATEPGTVYATAPFLTKRLDTEVYDEGVANGKQAGPGISGRPAFGVFQSGGKQVNVSTFELFKAMKGLPNEQFTDLELSETPASLSSRPIRGPRDVRSFILNGALSIDDPGDAGSFVRVQFHSTTGFDSEGFHAFDLYPETGRLELSRVVDGQATTLASGSLRRTGTRNYLVEIVVQDDVFEATISGTAAVTATLSRYTGADVTVSSHGAKGTFRSLELGIGGENDVDYSLMRLLGLLDVKYFVVQPNSTRWERDRLRSLPGLTEVETWGGSTLFENSYQLPDKAYVSPSYGVYAGDPVSITHGLYQIDPIARARVPLVGISDLPLDRASEITRKAEFVVIQADGTPPETDLELLRQSLEGASDDGVRRPLTVYSWDLSAPDAVARPDERLTAPIEVTPRQFELGRGKNFVLEGKVDPAEGSATPSPVALEFRVRSDEESYYLEVDVAGGIAKLEYRGPDKREPVGNWPFKPAPEGTTVRIAAVNDRIALFADRKLVFDITDNRIEKGGPLRLSTDGSGAVMSTVRLAAGAMPPSNLEGLINRGFDFSTVASVMSAQGDLSSAALGFSQLFATELPDIPSGRYRLVIAGTAARQPELGLWMSGPVRAPALRLNPVRYGVDAWSAPIGLSNWVAVSEPFFMPEGVRSLGVATEEPSARFAVMLLVKSEAVDPATDEISRLLVPAAAIPAETDKGSATAYQSLVDEDQAGVMVFTETFHKGWKARLDGNELVHFPAFGAVNAYWLPVGALDGPAYIKLNFAPQRAYRMAQFVSLAAFAAVCGLLAAPWVLRRLAARGDGQSANTLSRWKPALGRSLARLGLPAAARKAGRS